MNRRDFAKLGAAAALPLTVSAQQPVKPIVITKPIPSSGELIPAIGMGTWQTFDVGADSGARQNLGRILKTFVRGGGRVVDSSPMYGNSESVVGEVAEQIGVSELLFKASKVWTEGKKPGITQMQQSMQRMQTKKMDLMQVHNLIDVDTHLATIAEWKSDGKIRYSGITHYNSGGYSQMLKVMRRQPLDFIQINYSMLSREAEQQLFPLAQEQGVAVIVNRAYEQGRLFTAVRNKRLPAWAQEFDCTSWGQFFLKFVISHPAVTCVIPATSKVHHMQDNMQAGHGRLPTLKQRKKMLKYFQSI